MKTKWNWIVILTMLLGLVFTGPVQTVSAQASATAEFTFLSSPNPSNQGQTVTFTVSATGTDSTYPPFGYVEFLDNGVAIDGCTTENLNFPSGPAAGYPAVCTTASLAAGAHTITAKFTSMVPDIYADETITLPGGQTVNAPVQLTIYPATLTDVMITNYYEIPLIAKYPDGSGCQTCTWYATMGDLPEGMGLSHTTGVLSGMPNTVGTSTFTAVVQDGNGATGSQAYTLNVTKVIPAVEVKTALTEIGSTTPTTLEATASHPDPYYSPCPAGKIAFSVDGVPVPGCSGADAKPTNNEGTAYCASYLPTGVAAGSHEIQAEFTPDAASSAVYLSATGTGALQVNPSQAIVSGRVFMDNDQDGVKDETEPAQGTWHVFLNQDCDDFLEGDVVTNELTGAFSFYPVPTDDHTYCLYVDLSTYPGYVQTTPYNNLTLSGDQYFEIGVYYPHISILPASEELPMGTVGTYYEQVIEISGGTLPYGILVNSSLPVGLTFDETMLKLSGTPTAGGLGMLELSVSDSGVLEATKTYSLLIQSVGTFILESSTNPSGLGQEVTFTLSGSGSFLYPDYGSIPPIGTVTFYDGELPIDGCVDRLLNFDLMTNEPTVLPATCTTAALSEGPHTIQAVFSDINGFFNNATRTITQQIIAVSPLTLTAETLPHAEYQTPYSQQLTASGGTGPYTFSATGDLPAGITLNSDGLLSGTPVFPAAPDTYPITIQVVDRNGANASRDYAFVLDKGVPTVTVRTDQDIFWGLPFGISADVLKQTSETSYDVLDGTVAFFIDDIPVPGCGAVTEADAYYHCPGVSMDLDVATLHTVKVYFTPSGGDAGYYTSGFGSTEFTVQPSLAYIPGEVFMDANQNTVFDDGESRISGSGWTVNLDQGCDGTVEYSVQPSTGVFNFVGIPVSGLCHRITVDAPPGYQQTTQLADFYPRPGTAPFIEVGFYYPTIIVSPGTNELPAGTIGVEYSQAFTASGGEVPYVYTIAFGSLPDGLTLTPTGTLSGTPTQTGYYNFTVRAEDANHAAGQKNYNLTVEQVKVDGNFTFTSSSNPSNWGDPVTFTVSATGDVVIPGFGAVPPMGLITFSADGTPIEGCSNLYLNMRFDENGIPSVGDYPVTCTTAALEEGSHEITATYYDATGAYHVPSLVLTQQVIGAANTAPNPNPGGPYLAALGTAVTFDGSLSADADGDALTYAWDFGDGSTGTGAMPTHAYAAAGVYDACLTVNDGTVDSSPACTVAVIYDPGAGYVTGTGWIDSPAGAYKLDESLSGRASFGFVSQYKKGASVPSGNMEFKFKAGSFKFNSTSYDWLVVSKDKVNAQFKGSGMVNGALAPDGSAYRFMLWAGDSAPDTFRIRIWWEDADGVEHDVYDNGFNQAIGGGSIVVRTGK